MSVTVVRHAHAVSRRHWEGDDAWRVLSPKGEAQAGLLVAPLLAGRPTRIVSSPYLRCVATVELLAVAAGLVVEPDGRLAEGNDRPAVDLVRSLQDSGECAVVCSHGDVIPHLLVVLANEDGVDLGPDPRVEKGSVWILEGDRGRFTSARHIPPPVP